ncbi:MAG: P-loop NTPase fold protein, partial [Thiotrichaceae bacterium]
MAKGQGTFGHQQLAEQFTKRIKTHFNPKKSISDSSLVIGVFGEWGSGKSNILELIKTEFQQSNHESNPKNEQPPIVVIPFNPWRYEKEEYLIVPLINTMQLEVHHYLKAHEGKITKVKKELSKLTKFLGASTIAFSRGFKAKVGIPAILELEYDQDIAVKAQEDEDKKIRPDEAPLQQLHSYYYEFERTLKEFTQGKDGIKLLLLIDDLDRCLPEKAVEMLESIKLFLDVEGCAFVLALDDEVVERGIIHRYRDYLFQNDYNKNSHHSQLPITGIEYLEKIIQLPFRLPQPSKNEIRSFLIENYSDLFDPSKGSKDGNVLTSDPSSNKDDKAFRQEALQKTNPEAEELLELFIEHIPAVPRKQIRAAELLQLLLDMAKSRQCDDVVKRLPLAKLTLLQIFAPDLYRFGRRKYAEFMMLLEEWSEQDYWRYRDHFHNLIKIRYEIEAIENNKDLENTQQRLPSIVAKIIETNKEERDKSEKEFTASLQRTQNLYHRFYRELIETFEKASHNRSGFDLYRFVSAMKIGGTTLEPYFTLFNDGQAITESSAPTTALPEFETVVINDQDEFLDLLFSESESGWQSALSRSKLKNKVLDDDLFEQIMEQLNNGLDSFKQNPYWLAYLCPHLSQEHFQTLLEDSDHFKAVFADKDEAKDNQKAHLLNALRKQQRDLLSDHVDSIEKDLLKKMRDNANALKDRAEAGQLLNKLDRRKGVAVGTNDLPDIDWVTIPSDSSGNFKMGSDAKDEEAYDDEQPAHPVTIKEFKISRYPITNAQYRCFVDSGSYKDETLWNKLPEVAKWWLEGGEKDQKLLDSIKDKETRESYKSWLADDTAR